MANLIEITLVRRATGRLAGAMCFLLSLALAAVAVSSPAWAFPQMPHQFYGNVTINGSPAAPGVTVSARIGGLEYASTATDSQGRYGYSPAFFMVPADDPDTPAREGGIAGNLMEFYVAGVLGGTAAFASGQDARLDLAVSLAPPSVLTATASVSTTTATLNGNLTSRRTATTVNVSFEYGINDYSSTTTPRVMNSTGAFSAQVTGLTPGTLYHFRARADGGAHGVSTGADITFTTVAALDQSLTGSTPAPTPTPTPAPTPTQAPIPTPTPAPMPSQAAAPTPTPAPAPTPEPATIRFPSTALPPTPTSTPMPVTTPTPAPTATPTPATVPLPKPTPTPVRSEAPARPWALIIGITIMLLAAGSAVYIKLGRHRRLVPANKGETVESLHLEAGRLRKEVNNRCKQIVAGKVSVPGVSQKYLLAKSYFLLQVACSIDAHPMWAQRKSLQIDNGELQRYQKLIDWVRQMMP